MDCSDDDTRPVCKQFKVGGYPTIIYFGTDNRWYAFEQNRKIDLMAKFVFEEGYKNVNERD